MERGNGIEDGNKKSWIGKGDGLWELKVGVILFGGIWD